ncbi:unnamed protein product [Symbiodinium sp. CCMP2456]|nr:unnamed protein product [Symbiodinium sp. CCMP2456]
MCRGRKGALRWQLLQLTYCFLVHAEQCTTSTASVPGGTVVTIDCERSVVTITCYHAEAIPDCHRVEMFKTTSTVSSTVSSTSISQSSTTRSSTVSSSSTFMSTSTVTHTDTSTVSTITATTSTSISLTLSSSSTLSQTATFIPSTTSCTLSSTRTSTQQRLTTIATTTTATSTTSASPSRPGTSTRTATSMLTSTSLTTQTATATRTRTGVGTVAYLSGYLIMMASGVSRHQAELAVAAALVDYLQLERLAAVAATARREHLADTWNVSFSMEFPGAREEELLGQLRDLLASVEANVASTFSDILRIQLEYMGAEPSGHLPLLLGVDGLGSVPDGPEAEPAEPAEPAEAADSASIIVGIALAASAMGLMAYFFWRRRTLMPTLFQQLPEAFRYVWQKEPSGVACDIWQLEAERWDLAESVLRAAPFPLAPRWRGVWQWDADEKGKKEEHRLYVLRFSPGGQFSGFGRGRSDFTVSGGAMDGAKGVLKWREQDLGNCILECAGHWDRRVSLPTRIDGTFAAYDVTALPKRIGQGCFTLTADAEGVPAAAKGEATAPAAVSDLV